MEALRIDWYLDRRISETRKRMISSNYKRRQSNNALSGILATGTENLFKIIGATLIITVCYIIALEIETAFLGR